jgi:hypothetical protein
MSTHIVSKKAPVVDTTTETSFSMPPAGLEIASPPAGFVPTNGADYRGVNPSKAELAVLGGAVMELQGCPNLTAVFGKAVSNPALLLGVFGAASAWSSTRAKSSAFDEYCRTEEGLAWLDLRNTLRKVQPVIMQAIAADPVTAAQFTNLGRLLTAKSAAAQRAVATRKANKETEAKGETVTRGYAAKAKQKAAAKAALAEKLAAQAGQAGVTMAVSPAGQAAAGGTAAPVGTQVAAAASPVGDTSSAAPVAVNGVVAAAVPNAVAHS